MPLGPKVDFIIQFPSTWDINWTHKGVALQIHAHSPRLNFPTEAEKVGNYKNVQVFNKCILEFETPNCR